jgi:hypothetical protein
MGYVRYKIFHDQKLADELTSILEQNKIEYEVSKLSPSLDSSFRGSNPIEQEIIVKIKQCDFDRIDKIWENDLYVDLTSVDKDHSRNKGLMTSQRLNPARCPGLFLVILLQYWEVLLV